MSVRFTESVPSYQVLCELFHCKPISFGRLVRSILVRSIVPRLWLSLLFAAKRQIFSFTLKECARHKNKLIA